MYKDLLQKQHVELHVQQGFRHTGVAVKESIYLPGQKALRATEFIPANSIIFLSEFQLQTQRTRTSIQVAEKFHVEVDDFGAYTNHSCTPNAAIVSECIPQFNKAKLMLFLLCDVHQSQEIRFHYASTEYTLTSELLNKPCLCNSPNCMKQMRGYSQLSEDEKKHLQQLGIVLPYLLE